jgi:hypothetical protein
MGQFMKTIRETTTVAAVRLNNNLMSAIGKENTMQTSQQARSRRTVNCTLVSLLLFILLLAEQTAHAGVFFDGAVRVEVGATSIGCL